MLPSASALVSRMVSAPLTAIPFATYIEGVAVQIQYDRLVRCDGPFIRQNDVLAQPDDAALGRRQIGGGRGKRRNRQHTGQ